MSMDMKDQSSRFDPAKVPPAGYLIIANQAEDADAGIDLSAVLIAVSRRWIVLLVLTILGAAAAAVAAWSLPNKFRAQVLVAPVDSSAGDAISGLRSQVGGLASLAGIDLSGGGGRVEESFATLSSRGFAREFISANNLLPVLFAKNWDAVANKWHAGQKAPTLEDGVDLFLSEIRTVSEDRRTRLITISVEWTAPETAAQWANGLVDLANEKLRQDAIRISDRNVEYLKEELGRASDVELQRAIYRIMESQIHQAMLASVQREYAFRVVDRAVAPEKRVSPKQLTMLLVGAFIGLAGGFMVLFVYYAMKSKKSSAP